MKIRNIFILTALILAIFCFGACDSWDGSDNQGSIVINFDNSGGRYAVSNNDMAKMAYTVTMTSPGKTTIIRETKPGAKSISISLPEGIWDIDVKAEGEGTRIGKGAGKKTNVVVAAKKPASANIGMAITGTRVSSWGELKEDFDELKKSDGKLKSLEEIEIIAEKIDTNAAKMDDALILNTEKTITLWSEKNVTIKRMDSSSVIDATVFTIINGTLILDGTKGGNITIEGNGRDNSKCQRALINVEENGTLIMRDGITLTNNHTANLGGGVFVRDGKFYMEGGIISGNTAEESGGGVYIDGRASSSKRIGVFKKTGGIIYGSEESVDRNNRNISIKRNSGNGDAVYDKGTPFWNNTLGPDDNWPK
jgi:hypothetical protein